MKRLVAMMMCAVSLGAAAQSTITYPFNPDANSDGFVGVSDFPVESALLVDNCYSGPMRHLKLHYSDGWSLLSTGLTIDID